MTFLFYKISEGWPNILYKRRRSSFSQEEDLEKEEDLLLFEGEDLLDFSLALSNPSSLAQQQKLALVEQKFSIAGSEPEGMVSKTWIYQNIFGFNKDTIEQIQNDLIREKLNSLGIKIEDS